jgi:hypothetical protein
MARSRRCISVITVAAMTVLIGAIAALYPAIAERMEPYEAIGRQNESYS